MASQRREEEEGEQRNISSMVSYIQDPPSNVSEALDTFSSSKECDPIIPQTSDETVQWHVKSSASPKSTVIHSPVSDNYRRHIFDHLTKKNDEIQNRNKLSKHNTNGLNEDKKSTSPNYDSINSFDKRESNFHPKSTWRSEHSASNTIDNDSPEFLTEIKEVQQSNEESGESLIDSTTMRLNDRYMADSARDLISPAPSHRHRKKSKRRSVHETLHAQCLMLGLAFMAAWFPQNCMAPNLTEMAKDFGFNESERDIYLGANIALAAGVLSFPIAAGIGILADILNRKYLFCATVVLGGFSSYLTGVSQSYHQLFLARLLNGSFMSGSVPIAFSMLADLFDVNERNAASSGLTSMMGLGIILGQVYSGVVGSREGWRHPFYVSFLLSLITASLVLFLVKEPDRGCKEEVFKSLQKHGAKYERKLTWRGFVAAMRNNKSNIILISQGFFASIPWGVIFVFLNDYLSQERGFSVKDATYLVGVFGIGCAAGGILGGYWGQFFQSWNTSYLPFFMSATTFLGVFPFLFLLNGHNLNAQNFLVVTYSFLGGCLASMPSVCVRPCLINVNPPETRGAILTAANLAIQLARGAGPSCITLLGTIFNVNRQHSFNITLSVFWVISAIQLIFLAESLPKDQDTMNAELAEYAAKACEEAQAPKKAIVREGSSFCVDDSEPISIMEHHIVAVDAGRSMRFVGTALREIGDGISTMQPFNCKEETSSYCKSDDELETDHTSDSNLSGENFCIEHENPDYWRRELPEPDERTPFSNYYS